MWNLTGSGIVNLLFLRFEVTIIPVLVVLFPSFSCALDRKEITGLIAAYVENDEYSFMFATNLQEAIVLTTLLQQRNVERMMTYE